MAMPAYVEDSLESMFHCAICLEAYIKPLKITGCGHVFCTACIADDLELVTPKCPLCRETYNPAQTARDKKLERRMDTTKAKCTGCNKKFAISKLNSHSASCSKIGDSHAETQFKPVADTSQTHSSVPNRCTFTCPYCGARNLDYEGLRNHCNSDHQEERSPVTCPICSSMPWGDPNYKSTNFLTHLNLRHKFEYNTYVDFQNNEDEVLKQVLQNSMLLK